MNENQSAFLLRPYPNNNLQIENFRKESIIALGWEKVGACAEKSRSTIKQELSTEYSLSGVALSNACIALETFIFRMKIGDLILLPVNEDIYFCEITGEYFYNDTVDYAHQRKAQWIATSVSRKQLSNELRASLKVRRLTADLTSHVEEIKSLARGERYVKSERPGTAIEVSYPLRPNFNINFQIPNDITKSETERLITYFSTLYFVDK